tara:strand:- start:151 stop:744 length:594 start_codon:yes stop_codon:yes gene_type:complete
MSIDIQVNKSKVYFVPLFNKEVPISYTKDLKNTYFWYDDQDEETFCLLYKFNGKVTGSFQSREGFTVYEKTLFAHKLFKGYRDYGEYVIYEFDLTEELIVKKNKLLMGEYSKFSDEDKKKIITYNTRVYGKESGEYISNVLHKDKNFMNELAIKLKVPVNLLPEATSIINPEKELFANYIKEELELGIDEKEPSMGL